MPQLTVVAYFNSPQYLRHTYDNLQQVVRFFKKLIFVIINHFLDIDEKTFGNFNRFAPILHYPFFTFFSYPEYLLCNGVFFKDSLVHKAISAARQSPLSNFKPASFVPKIYFFRKPT